MLAVRLDVVSRLRCPHCGHVEHRLYRIRVPGLGPVRAHFMPSGSVCLPLRRLPLAAAVGALPLDWQP